MASGTFGFALGAGRSGRPVQAELANAYRRLDLLEQSIEWTNRMEKKFPDVYAYSSTDVENQK